MEFRVYSFKELLSEIVDNRGKTCPTSDSGIPLIATNCIKNDALYAVYEKVRYVSNETYKNWFRGHPKPDDIIFVCKGSPGRVAWVQDPVPYCIAQDMVSIRANTSIIDSKYLFALLRSPKAQRQIENMHVGTLIPHFKKGDFQNLYFEIPTDLEYQKFVGELYYILNKKIEQNQQTNQTLEKMAQALFKSWFVDFDPVIDNALAAGIEIPDALQHRVEIRKKAHALQKQNPNIQPLPEATQRLFPSEFEHCGDNTLGIQGWIPKGWEVTSFESLISLVGGGTPKTTIDDYWGGNIPWFSVVDAPIDSDVFVIDTEKHVTQLGVNKSSTKILREGTTIISARGTVGKCALVGSPMAMNQSCYGIVGRFENHDEYIYFLTRYQVSDLQKRGHGSVFNTITRETFKSISLAKSDDLLTQKFSESVRPYLAKILSNNKQNVELTKLRDVLLPKLISGEVII